MTKSFSGKSLGINAGHIVTVRELPTRPVQRKGVVSKRVKHVRELIREVAGLAPYEKRIIELLRVGKDKRARRLTKKRLGTLVRAKRKVDEMSAILVQQRRGA
ncbi:50S ribosomal protein L36e [Fonticula alba]|uniref:60S ribosomal protein L36 n=1 Tax=Fonticula alba TaxID=691883 RepID=A0A058Z7F8_FONAL|nr:50S ribosomal protein L36e [Fonticula alba]KCV70021.1 50S ribosomal protein L36e [Fonticula alba]|eukprot:XP_009495627.1 50S ribosomal protein L36e [Fonticula alba]